MSIDSIIMSILEELFVYLLKFPGAFFRWLFAGFKRPFKEILNGDDFLNVLIGLVTQALIVVTIVFLCR